jgi:EAL domain-containing protein (putative c-di-GMP-specific phosphodiesterase class I)
MHAMSQDDPSAPPFHSGAQIDVAACALSSVFQPIFSLSHQRVIGHEALLRANDRGGRIVSPQGLFRACGSEAKSRSLDETARAMHAGSFARQVVGAQWLFLNVDASVFAFQQVRRTPAEALLETAQSANLLPNQIVVELLETKLPEGKQCEASVKALQAAGFLIALDDFGAGHSNFDRVFRLQPQIVKLDRSVIVRASGDLTVRRVMTQMISLLHECSALVLVEGIETAEEAAIALDSDADFVQGYYFGRPEIQLRHPRDGNPGLAAAWASCDERARRETRSYQMGLRRYGETLTQAVELMRAGRPLEEASQAFLTLPDAEVCYLLDEKGAQVGNSVCCRVDYPAEALLRFAPLIDAQGARWSRRPYFRRAMAAPGQLQVTRPYPTMQSHRTCVTFSVCFESAGLKLVLCGDMLWHSHNARPGFGATVNSAMY